MKKIVLISIFLLAGYIVYAQQNFPAKAIGTIPRRGNSNTITNAAEIAGRVAATAINSGASLPAAVNAGVNAVGNIVGGDNVIRSAAIAAANSVQNPPVALSSTRAASIGEATARTTAVTMLSSGSTIGTQLMHRFALYGMGDVNTQSLSDINASGKLSAFVCPVLARIRSNTIFITALYESFNVNAINKDTLLAGTILFPDLGNSSFLSTLEAGLLSGRNSGMNNGFKYYYGVLGEFATKRVVVEKDKDTSKSGYFNMANITTGFKLALYYKDPNDASAPLISASLLVYYNYVHIPDKDAYDYRKILGQNSLFPNSLNSIGAKVTFGINNMQFFADVRHTRYSGDVLDRRLHSLNSNIGVLLPVEINISGK